MSRPGGLAGDQPHLALQRERCDEPVNTSFEHFGGAAHWWASSQAEGMQRTRAQCSRDRCAQVTKNCGGGAVAARWSTTSAVISTPPSARASSAAPATGGNVVG